MKATHKLSLCGHVQVNKKCLWQFPDELLCHACLKQIKRDTHECLKQLIKVNRYNRNVWLQCLFISQLSFSE